MKRIPTAIKAHIEQVADSLRDSQEHSQIVYLERRMKELKEELRQAEKRTKS